ncbi:efflux transporter, RND family, MFP subunit [Russula earlei]|uniref:Efflux transporter, RND family, MFP subunit n=1 Tax=Russula earlei TaxID=71964 RepID=A0ACC0TR13_9AGAM|nr:efflux transporter, RND family, MFP subunit [Russula earlei]
MQKILHTALFATTILLVSCGAKNNDSAVVKEKKAKLEALKKDQEKLNTDIAGLEKEIAKLDPASAKEEKAKLVATAAIAPEKFTHFIDLQGKIDAVNISNITPRNGTGGQVKAVLVKKGDVVRKGQLLLQLDDVLPQKNVSAAEQNVAAVKTQADLNADLYKRKKNLWDQGIGTEVDVITAKSVMENSQRQLQYQQAQLKVAQEQVNFTSVYSDVDGVADDVNIRVGEIFTGISSAGTPQIKIVNTTNLKVLAQVPENYAGRVKVGSHVSVSLPDINKTINAAVTVASTIIDPASHSFYIEAKIPSDKDFRPNQVAMVNIQDYVNPKAITVPVNALQSDDKSKFVMVAVQQGNRLIAKKKEVIAGEFYGDKLEVKSGLVPGDVVITEGYQGLYDGQLITTK